MDLPALQAALRDQRIHAWLIYDFRNSNPVLAQLLPRTKSGQPRHLTRRAALIIPAQGEPTLLCSVIDANQFEGLPFPRQTYLSWQQFRAALEAALQGSARVAMEYAPGGGLPVVSLVDAGTVDMVRSFGLEVVSSADLVQVSIARWSEDAQREHARASTLVASAKDAAFDLIRQRTSSGAGVSEYEVQQFILSEFKKAGLEWPDAPIVAANAHAGDPHFEVSATSPATIKRGDWVLIDLWARVPGDHNIYSDITWVGFCGREPSPKHREVFNTVKAARDAAVKLAQAAHAKGQTLQGWQLDQASRDVIIAAGYESAIRHRTGHSLSPGPKVHGIGVNIDNLETHDTRTVLPGIGFTVEPGIYLPDFGVRLEINVFMHPAQGPIVTSCIQDDILLLA